MTKAFRINIRQYALDGPGKRTRRTMPKNPVTVTHFNPVQAAAAKSKAKELAGGNEDLMIMIKPDIYIVMNSAKHIEARPKVIKNIRKEHGLA